MNKRLITTGIASFIMGAVIFIGLGSTMAANNGNGNMGADRGPIMSQEQRVIVDSAIENGNYGAWVEAMGDTNNGITEKVNEGNFTRFAEAHKLMLQGRESMEAARAIMEELGIERGPKEGKGPQKRITEEQRVALDNAFQNNDYNTWKELSNNSPMADKINESNFARFAEAHRLMKGGDMEGAKVIFDELGLKKGPAEKMGQKGGKMGGPRAQR